MKNTTLLLSLTLFFSDLEHHIYTTLYTLNLLMFSSGRGDSKGVLPAVEE